MKNIGLLLLLFPVVAFSQKFNRDSIHTGMLDSVRYDISPETLAPSEINLPFKGIEVIDARFDTCKLGFEIHKKYDRLRYLDFKKIKLAGGVSKSIEDFYNEYYKLCFRGSANKLLIVLKTLWIDNAPSPEFKQKRNFVVETEAFQNIHVKFEYYLKKQDGYYPIKRIDTVYQLTEQNFSSSELHFRRNDLSFFLFTLKSLIEKYDFEQLTVNADLRRKLSISSIDSFNTKRFLQAVLVQQSVKKGVFLNFTEFSSNSPSVPVYEVKKVKKEDLLFAAGDSVNIKNYWAISDSLGLHFEYSDDKKIVKTGNTFEFFIHSYVFLPKTFAGSLINITPFQITDTRGGFGENRIISGNGARLHFVLVPRQINMETGEIY